MKAIHYQRCCQGRRRREEKGGEGRRNILSLLPTASLSLRPDTGLTIQKPADQALGTAAVGGRGTMRTLRPRLHNTHTHIFIITSVTFSF